MTNRVSLLLTTLGLLATFNVTFVYACDPNDLSTCDEEISCIEVGGYWFDESWKCIANQGERSYVDNGDGTITDKVASLVWQQGQGAQLDWGEAKNYCSNLVFGNPSYSNWRLPTIDELKSLVICTNGTPTPLLNAPNNPYNCDGIDGYVYPPSGNYAIPTISPLFQSTNSLYWSIDTNGSGWTQVAKVGFTYGSVGYSSTSSYGYTRCVRDTLQLSAVIQSLKVIVGLEISDHILGQDINGDNTIGLAEIIHALKTLAEEQN